jgi:MscS family membrane protein
MYNRRIKASISLRYEDLPRIETIAQAVNELLHNHPDIDSKQMILVSFNEWADSSINLLVYCFTRTTVWSEYLAVQQTIFLAIAKIVQEAGGNFAFNCTTLYPAPDLDSKHPIHSLTTR